MSRLFSESEHLIKIETLSVFVREFYPLSTQQGTLVFFHGRLSNSGCWDAVVERLAPHFRCVLVEFPGFGKSTLSEARPYSLVELAIFAGNLIERLSPSGERVILVGHDTGGAIAQLCGIRQPDRISGLVLMNSTCLGERVESFSTGLRGFSVRRRLKSLSRSTEATIGLAADALREAWGCTNCRRVLVKSLRAIEGSVPGTRERRIWKQELAHLTQPVLILWGKKDDLNSPFNGFELMRCVAQAYYFENEACGHWPFLDEPGWIADKMREFIFRITTARGEPISRARKSLSR